MSKEYSDFLKPSDFERRCDEFVEEVEGEVVGDYPELEIHPVNSTREDLMSFPEMIGEAEKHEIGERIIESLKGLDKIREILSAYESRGIVEVWGRKGKSAVPQIKEASDRIDSIAKRHGGKKIALGDEEEKLKDPDLPSALLTYTFE